VQGCIEQAVTKFMRSPERVVVRASGRTDTGVHARAQVAAFVDPRALPVEAWLYGLPQHLPPDLAVVGVKRVPESYDPRREARGKRYVYLLGLGGGHHPLIERNRWLLDGDLDLLAMRRAADELLGEHDFTSFRGARCQAKSSVRKLEALEIEREGDRRVRVVARGNGFLRHMVRNLVGTLVEVGEGRRAPEEMASLLAAKDRRLAGRTAPAKALTLDAVYYADEVVEGVWGT